MNREKRNKSQPKTPAKISPRAAAIKILVNWGEIGGALDQGRDIFLAQSPIADSRDLQLCNAIIFGVLRNRGYLDWIIGEFSNKPLAKLKAEVRNALRVGLYQIIFLDRVPDSAAINETINALKKAGRPKWLTGFVNGILRNIVRNKDVLAKVDDNENNKIPAHCRLSHPQWLYDRWRQRYGVEVVHEICRENNQQADLCLRVTNDRAEFMEMLADYEIGAEIGKYSPQAVKLPEYRGTIDKIPGYKEGLFQVQDEAAQLVTWLMATMPAGIYLDACAGLGGKTTHLAALLGKKSKVVALDPSDKRLGILFENLNRLGWADRVDIHQGTVQEFARLTTNKFNGILIDAPCSGLGVIRRHPEIRWQRTEKGLQRYQKIQLEILTSAASILAPDGVMVYATCSTEPEENDAVVEKFLNSHDDFCLQNAKEFLPKAARGLVDEKGCLRTLPGEVDGFFAVLLQRS